MTGAWRPLLRAVIEAVLAFDDPDFPIGVELVEQRLLAGPAPWPLLLGPLARLSSFAEIEPAAREAERALLAGEGLAAGEIARCLADKETAERDRFAAFAPALADDDFVRAPLAVRRGCLRLWAGSAFAARRRRHAALKSLVLMAAYALPELERAVAGPR